MDKPTEYFDSARKPCKKTGSGDSSQMAYLTENLNKLENHNKSKKHSKKRARYSSDSDLDSDYKKYTVVPESGPSR
jgi:ribosomal protein S15P/S13E